VKTLHAKISSCPFFTSKEKKKRTSQSLENGSFIIQRESVASSFFED